MAKLKDIDYSILFELMKNSKISDRQMAKKIGVSQPTVTRRRARLEKEGFLEYTTIPNFEKLGFEIMSFSFSKWTSEALTEMLPTEEFNKQVQKFLSKHPNVILATTGGSGLGGMDNASITVHKNYAEYHNWVNEIRSTWGKYVAEFQSFIFSLEGKNVVRNITSKFLWEYIREAVKS